MSFVHNLVNIIINDAILLSNDYISQPSKSFQYKSLYRLISTKSISENDIADLRMRSLLKGGFLFNAIRRKAWPMLLSARSVNNWRSFITHNSDQVAKDINRSLCNYDITLLHSTTERISKRDTLESIINAILCKYSFLHYVQGFHDLCSVFLLVFNGDDDAYSSCEALSLQHIADYLRPDLSVLMSELSLLFPLISMVDTSLYLFLKQSEVLPHFAIAWVLTWCSHNIASFSKVARLFDFFISSPPIMPLYFSAVLIIQQKELLLQQPCEFTAVHAFFQDFPQDIDIDKCVSEAHNLYEANPLDSVLRVIDSSSALFPLESPLLMTYTNHRYRSIIEKRSFVELFLHIIAAILFSQTIFFFCNILLVSIG